MCGESEWGLEFGNPLDESDCLRGGRVKAGLIYFAATTVQPFAAATISATFSLFCVFGERTLAVIFWIV